jgi:hypothetical protein
MLRFDLDFAGFRDILLDIKNRQIPYATSRALNDVARDVQTGERQGIAERFILRRPEWIQQGVKIPRFSDKRDKPIQVSIEMDEGAGRGNIMSKFEPGGPKTAQHGGDVAVPIGARPNPSDLIPPELRPKALQLAAVGNSVRGLQRTYLVQMANGRRAIFQRVGRGQSRLLYWLTPSVTLPAILHFYDNARAIIPKSWPERFRQRFAEAMSTARD